MLILVHRLLQQQFSERTIAVADSLRPIPPSPPSCPLQNKQTIAAELLTSLHSAPCSIHPLPPSSSETSFGTFPSDGEFCRQYQVLSIV